MVGDRVSDSNNDKSFLILKKKNDFTIDYQLLLSYSWKGECKCKNLCLGNIN